MKIVAQDVFLTASRWSGKPCIHTLVDMGKLALASSGDIACFDEDLLALFPALSDFGDVLARGALMPEVVGRVACELQQLSGVALHAEYLHGKGGQVHLILPYDDEKIALKAITRALNIVGALAAGEIASIRADTRVEQRSTLHHRGVRLNTIPLPPHAAPAAAP